MTSGELGWRVVLNGVQLSGGDAEGLGCLSAPPSGLGLPPLRTEDVTYPQRDGVKHFSDWYEPRIITLEGVTVCSEDCPGCGGASSARVKVREIVNAWSRSCADTELVIFTDCDGQYDLPPMDAITNYILNSSFEVSDFAIATLSPPVTSTRSRSIIAAYVGDWSLRTAAIFADTTLGSAVATDSLSLGTYTFSVYVRPDATKDYRPYVKDITGVSSNGTTAPNVTCVGGVWTRLSHTFIVTTAGTFEAGWIGDSTPSTPGEVVFADAFMVTDGLVVENYFDGDGAFPTLDPRYGDLWSWTGTPHESTSVQAAHAGVRESFGPYGVKGRARVAEVNWVGWGTKCATLTLRFDSEDHRLYVLDAAGTPGSGSECVVLETNAAGLAKCYDNGESRCYIEGAGFDSYCYDTVTGTDGGDVTVTVNGSMCVRPLINLVGPLSQPRIENVTTGQTLLYSGQIQTGETVTIDTFTGTAATSLGGVDRTYLLSGDVRMVLDTGDNVLRLTSFSSEDTGFAEVCWRSTVDSA